MTQDDDVKELRERLNKLYAQRLRSPTAVRKFMVGGGFVTPKGNLPKRYQTPANATDLGPVRPAAPRPVKATA